MESVSTGADMVSTRVPSLGWEWGRVLGHGQLSRSRLSYTR